MDEEKLKTVLKKIAQNQHNLDERLDEHEHNQNGEVLYGIIVMSEERFRNVWDSEIDEVFKDDDNTTDVKKTASGQPKASEQTKKEEQEV